MKTIALGMLLAALAASTAWAQHNVTEDSSAEGALLTWHDPVPWQVGLGYERLARPVKLAGAEMDLKADVVEGMVGVAPWPWLLLYGHVGAAEAELEKTMAAKGSGGAGGLVGARVNVWQIYEGVENSAWRVTLQLAGEYSHRTSADDGAGELEWDEGLVMLPIDYHLSFARRARNVDAHEFQSLHAYVGPAVSALDGTWTCAGVEQDFSEKESFGVVGGGEMWLLANLAFGARVDWFDGVSGQVTLRYRF